MKIISMHTYISMYINNLVAHNLIAYIQIKEFTVL